MTDYSALSDSSASPFKDTAVPVKTFTPHLHSEELVVLAEAIPQIVWVLDGEGITEYCNRRWLDYTGLNFEQLTNSGWMQVIHPEDIGLAVEKWNEAFKKKAPYETEYRLRRFDGVYRWHLTRAVPIKDKHGKLLRWFGTSTDINDQRKYQEELRLSQERYRLVMDNTSDLVTLLDPIGNIIYASPSYETILGYKPKELIGKNIYELVEPKEKIAVEEGVEKLLERGTLPAEISRIRRKDKETRMLESKASVVYNENHKPAFIVATAHDITERVELEKRKDEFISSASHELKTPIATIKGFTQILSQLFKNDTKASYYLTKMNTQIDRITLLVNDLLDVSRIESGKLSLKADRFDISKLVRESVEDIQAQSLRHKIILKLPKQALMVEADYFRLSQVLINLISNAVKYSPKSDQVIIIVLDQEIEVEVSIQDFGIGISQRNLEKIFDKFYQVETKIRPSFSGLGLGLHISSEIIKKHGGKIWAESEKGLGSTFKFRIPKVQKMNQKQ